MEARLVRAFVVLGPTPFHADAERGSVSRSKPRGFRAAQYPREHLSSPQRGLHEAARLSSCAVDPATAV
jgi:hypothetical protein